MSEFYAHSFGDDVSHWEKLDVHLREVAEKAGEFAAAFSAREWGEAAGWWHDLGKFSVEFQDRLRGANGLETHLENLPGRVDHSTAGAVHAIKQLKLAGRVLAYCIAGHHAGLADAVDSTGNSGLDDRLSSERIEKLPKTAPPDRILQRSPKENPKRLFYPARNESENAFQVSLFCRMLFSSLVDADFLATERFYDPGKSEERCGGAVPFTEWEAELDRFLLSKTPPVPLSTVNACRQDILGSCRVAAALPPGLFTLTVPTGGGKTLSSLAFALRHANVHGMRRIIYAIPFTSIIEQTAEVYRNVFKELGSDLILEHHSAVDPLRETAFNRLASENWDAQLIVTTNVQFFESFFATGTSRCRKLHRVAHSVIVLDEAQTIPVELFRPCLALLEVLTKAYGCTVVLCTATQPALIKRDGFPIGLSEAREIINNPQNLYDRMRRVNVSNVGEWTLDQVAERVVAEMQVLCIVNTRPYARELYDRATSGGTTKLGETFLLTTNLCANHRSQVLATIRRRLFSLKSCRVISTQLIEAGVDIDFPFVLRAAAGVDSIAQAAGRCNREGLRERGEVIVFDPEGMKTRGLMKDAAATMREIAPDHPDLLDLAAVQAYFEQFYVNAREYWRKERVMEQLADAHGLKFNFRQAEEHFRFIEAATKSIVVPWGEEGQQLARRLSSDQRPDRETLRRVQRFVVPVYENAFAHLVKEGDVAVYHDQFAVLTNPGLYDERLGLCMERAGIRDPGGLIC